MNREEAVAQIMLAAQVLPPLHREVHVWARKRIEGANAQEKWSKACAEFQLKHRELAFLDGWYSARDRLRSGDQDALEFALCFIEIRPYFFRSGYMYIALIKCLNSVVMTSAQRRRYERVKTAYVEYKRQMRRREGDE